MLSDLLPLMTDTVRQQHFVELDLFGRPQSANSTDHRARVVNTPGQAIGVASRQPLPDAAATVWLIDHPHRIATGDTFELPDASVLKVARVERRALPGGILTKVYLT